MGKLFSLIEEVGKWSGWKMGLDVLLWNEVNGCVFYNKRVE